MTPFPWPADAPLFGSGRDALVALVRWGAEVHGWRRLRLPGWYCPEVPAALRAIGSAGMELCAWTDAEPLASPAVPAADLAPADVVVVANQLGVRPCPDPAALAAAVAATGAVLVEDHSHDLASSWARDSRADFAFASLRKTLPLPDGGVVWSPQGRELPPEPAGAETGGIGAGGVGEDAAADLSAALARRDPAPTDGPLPFRALARSGAPAEELAVGSGGPIAPVSRALLPTMPVDAWRVRRAQNLAILAEETGPVRGGRALPSPPGGVAFAFTVLYDDPADRDRALAALEARAVAPVVLWPPDTTIPGVGTTEVELSRRLLSVGCDQRYDDADMRALGRVLREVIGG